MNEQNRRLALYSIATMHKIKQTTFFFKETNNYSLHIRGVFGSWKCNRTCKCNAWHPHSL